MPLLWWTLFTTYMMFTKQHCCRRKLFVLRDDRFNKRKRLTVGKWTEQWNYFTDFDQLDTEDKPANLITFMFNMASTLSSTPNPNPTDSP